MSEFFTAKNRAWLYRIAIAAVALVTAVGLLDPSQSPLWLALIAAVLGIAAPVTALRHITPDSDGAEIASAPEDATPEEER